MDNGFLEINKRIKGTLVDIEDDCERENKLTEKDFSKFEDDLERVNFRKRRMDFVT